MNKEITDPMQGAHGDVPHMPEAMQNALGKKHPVVAMVGAQTAVLRGMPSDEFPRKLSHPLSTAEAVSFLLGEGLQQGVTLRVHGQNARFEFNATDRHQEVELRGLSSRIAATLNELGKSKGLKEPVVTIIGDSVTVHTGRITELLSSALELNQREALGRLDTHITDKKTQDRMPHDGFSDRVLRGPRGAERG